MVEVRVACSLEAVSTGLGRFHSEDPPFHSARVGTGRGAVASSEL